MAKDKVSASHDDDIPPGLRSKTSHDALVLSTAPGKAHMCSMFQMNKVSAPDHGDNPEPQVLYKTVKFYGLYVMS